MDYRLATGDDLDLLAVWNRQLIQDEGHRNAMTLTQLRERMDDWLVGEYRAVIFSVEAEPVAYALYRESHSEVYLRQLFVARDYRRQGIGREAIGILQDRLWPRTKRLTVEVLVTNTAALHFWRAVGYRDYSLMLEILPERE